MTVAINRKIGAEEYLQGELGSDVKHELTDGEAYAMAGVSKNHDRIAGNIYRLLGNFLGDSPCEPFSTDILVEVLSKSTRRIDETIKRMAYPSIPNLQEYILIEQDFVDIEVCRRNDGWIPKHYFLGDQFSLESIGLSLSMEEIYHRADNDDVMTYLQGQQTNANLHP